MTVRKIAHGHTITTSHTHRKKNSRQTYFMERHFFLSAGFESLRKKIA